ncbi:uncharacterized protein LOC110943032 [Helianthus annuus]|uniref:uncharacterized protein LOC110943032 n=1 Tax=Helianthus annuus TaxID=4232 RepID=UPI000B8FBBDF|nr:uncharacterized protein LOC110943032 [Helianthus annuus]
MTNQFWIHSYRLRGRSFCDIPMRSNVTWTWRKLLSLRPMVQQHLWIKIGDGKLASMWFDKWDAIFPLSSFITPRAIANAGFTLNAKVADVFRHGEWEWSDQWLTRYPILHNMQHINLWPMNDRVVWQSSAGKELVYSTFNVWDDIRVTQNEVQWAALVWFPQAIPRHSFFIWLLINKKLKTQDVMATWSASGNMNFNLMCCSLCSVGPGSHEHLFFECSYGSQVWNGIKDMAGLTSVVNSWDMIFGHLVQVANSMNARHVISKLVVSVPGYFVW